MRAVVALYVPTSFLKFHFDSFRMSLAAQYQNLLVALLVGSLQNRLGHNIVSNAVAAQREDYDARAETQGDETRDDDGRETDRDTEDRRTDERVEKCETECHYRDSVETTARLTFGETPYLMEFRVDLVFDDQSPLSRFFLHVPTTTGDESAEPTAREVNEFESEVSKDKQHIPVSVRVEFYRRTPSLDEEHVRRGCVPVEEIPRISWGRMKLALYDCLTCHNRGMLSVP